MILTTTKEGVALVIPKRDGVYNPFTPVLYLARNAQTNGAALQNIDLPN